MIDGNTAGVNNDWDSLPPNLLDSDTTADACGSGVLDPTQLDGKLDALNVNNPNPTPGNVVNKGDFCRVWRAVEAVPDAAGNLNIVLYGAWQRYFANGEVTGYWPILGPDPSQDDDYLIAFEYESSSSAPSKSSDGPVRHGRRLGRFPPRSSSSSWTIRAGRCSASSP